jgi:hypothetical protein
MGTFGKAEQTGRAMKTKFVFTVVYKNDFSIKFKARLVACGYSQVQGIDYEETFSPTTPILAVFIVLHLAARSRLHKIIFDVKGAFLEGENDYVQYGRLPREISQNFISERVRIIKSLYGEKQAPKIWSDLLHNILVKLGFERCPVVACLYKKTVNDNFMYLCVHVDDGLVMSNSEEFIADFLEIFLKEVNEIRIFKPI